MKMISLFTTLLKGKGLVAVIGSALVIGSVTAFAATTPVRQNMVHALASQARSGTPAAQASSKGQKGENKSQGAATPIREQESACPGLPTATQLASQYGLSSASNGAAVKAICALHTGAFQGTTPGGTAVSSHRVFGYGEINELLTVAQLLAAHNSANAAGKLTDSNVTSYLAAALQVCGTTPLEVCVKNQAVASPQAGSNGNGHKPAATPTPPISRR
ncbi:hypothetical protein [Thermogemmatispora sp.]|uniref:hypothetical protein n=1 Tax=Thermogemmatispora sp. TaxID=1968838 RepID=UPI0035E4594C